MKLNYLTLEEILRLHFQVIEDYGGIHGVRDEGRLKSAVEAPKLNAFGIEQYTSVYQKGAVYLRNIIGDHPFSDGNKRTALTVSVIFLQRNGVVISVDPKGLEEFTIKVATRHLSIDEIANWFKLNSK